MDRRIGLFAGLTALFAMGSAHAQICPAVDEVATGINDESGHTFFLYTFRSTVAAADRTWVNAKACVSGLDDLSGVPAHLATITSTSENQWIVANLLKDPATSLPRLDPSRSQAWVGGKQDGISQEPGEGWRWENNEGPIPVPGLNIYGYSNWKPAPNPEPNDTSPGEDHLTLGRFSADLGLWNDEGSALSSIAGFIVEYDTPRTLTGGGCVPGTITGTTSCPTVDGQTLTFPPGTFKEETEETEGSSITFSAFEFRDPRVDESGRCVGINNVRGPLVLFDDPAFDVPADPLFPDGPKVSGKVVIPAYLCGSPNFIVVRTQAENITIPTGIVLTKNNTQTILPDNSFECNAPILEGGNPQEQDVGVWQSLDGTEMWESGTHVQSPYFGTAAELTTGCGSTLIKTRTKSNFAVGLHIDFDVDRGSAAEYNEFVALTQYKISLVRQSVVEARGIGSISDANGRAMLSQLDSAAGSLAANSPVNAAKKIQDFLKKVNSSTYSTSLTNPFNFNGDHLSRGENILFTLKYKVIPFKP